jgi:hypothetical protein
MVANVGKSHVRVEEVITFTLCMNAQKIGNDGDETVQDNAAGSSIGEAGTIPRGKSLVSYFHQDQDQDSTTVSLVAPIECRRQVSIL